jgi:hypothetical protein
MLTGSQSLPKPPGAVADRLRLLLAARGCRLLPTNDDKVIQFESPGQVGKASVAGTFRALEEGLGTRLVFSVGLSSSFIRSQWLTAIVLCWTIIAPIFALAIGLWESKTRPQEFVDTIIAGL